MIEHVLSMLQVLGAIHRTKKPDHDLEGFTSRDWGVEDKLGPDRAGGGRVIHGKETVSRGRIFSPKRPLRRGSGISTCPGHSSFSLTRQKNLNVSRLP